VNQRLALQVERWALLAGVHDFEHELLARIGREVEVLVVLAR